MKYKFAGTVKEFGAYVYANIAFEAMLKELPKKEAMDGDETEAISKHILKMLNEFYANI